MILKTLKATNFRVFNGMHEIDLEPRIKYGRRRPIILFGGLNGSGKTTTLSAVRLALHGKGSLGRNASKRAYEDYLRECVHLPPKGQERPSSCSIELTFDHPNNGLISLYDVRRKWEVVKDKVHESLEISENGKSVSELSYEQCQAFLNELVPIGVADLFFFDGEKIADLAEEEGSTVLQEAINRLMGIDIVHRLRGDLSTYLKEQGLSKQPHDRQKVVSGLEAEHKAKMEECEALKNERTLLDAELHTLCAEIRITERNLDEKGGAWASSRKEEEGKLVSLIKERDILSDSIRQLLSGLMPLSLAKTSLQSLLGKLEAEQNLKRQRILEDSISTQLDAFKGILQVSLPEINKAALGDAVQRSFSKLFCKVSGEIIHDLSESNFAKIKHIIEVVVPAIESELGEKTTSLDAVESQIEHISRNIDRSPDEGVIEAELERLRDQTKQVVELEHKKKIKLEELKRTLRGAMDLLKKLRRLEQELSKSEADSIAITYAKKSLGLLQEFSTRTVSQKIKRLESEFSRSFTKLARKDDISMSASISPETFSVSLRDSHGNMIKKQQLSAGEKQIYAIAMLEALGRTTGRSLPIIIDTPLGRLDSHHRSNLVRNYFPVASHQVIILSTDTEVDEDFFNGLHKEISHGYEIQYEPSSRSSEIAEGYFWKHTAKETV